MVLGRKFVPSFALVDFFAVDDDISRRVNADRGSVTLNRNHFDCDVSGDADLFTGFAGKD